MGWQYTVNRWQTLIIKKTDYHLTHITQGYFPLLIFKEGWQNSGKAEF
jgi:hypothetical protein